METYPYKIVIVGDGCVGKTCMLLSYTSNNFPVGYIPTIFDNYTCRIVIDHSVHTLSLWDTAGQKEYVCLRPLSYPNTHCFIICYAIDTPSSLDNVRNIWIPEIRRFSNTAAIVIVGTKSDLRELNSDRFITTEEGQHLCKELKADSFVECSAKTRNNLSRVFVEAVRAIQLRRKKQMKPVVKSTCSIL